MRFVGEFLKKKKRLKCQLSKKTFFFHSSLILMLRKIWFLSIKKRFFWLWDKTKNTQFANQLPLATIYTNAPVSFRRCYCTHRICHTNYEYAWFDLGYVCESSFSMEEEVLHTVQCRWVQDSARNWVIWVEFWSDQRMSAKADGCRILQGMLLYKADVGKSCRILCGITI